MTYPDPPSHYTLKQVSKMFHSPPGRIKARCIKGDFDFVIDGNGYWHITRESVLKHLPELEAKNNR